MSTTILQDVSKQQNGTFNSVNCLFLILTTFYLIQLCYSQPQVSPPPHSEQSPGSWWPRGYVGQLQDSTSPASSPPFSKSQRSSTCHETSNGTIYMYYIPIKIILLTIFYLCVRNFPQGSVEPHIYFEYFLLRTSPKMSLMYQMYHFLDNLYLGREN